MDCIDDSMQTCQFMCCYCACYGADETWDMRIHMQGFIVKHGQNTGRVGQ